MGTVFQATDHIYFIGIGGISMSALAEMLASRNIKVSGSDMKASKITDELQNQGITIYIGQKAENINDDVTHVVYTAAIAPNNPELKYATEKKIPLVQRGTLLGEIMTEHPHSVGVAGTHGKTTTTSMVSEILLSANLDPTITVGGILPTIGSNLRIGKSSYFVAEACEYCNSFLSLSPTVGIILNVEEDHLDFFSSLEEIYESFHEYAQKIPDHGLLILNAEIENMEEITKNLTTSIETFSVEEGTSADWVAKNITYHDEGSTTFDVYYHDEFQETIHLNIPGNYNITNALASIATAHFFEIESAHWKSGLLRFMGTQRRFQRKGEKNGVAVIDDYAHHPTEIVATLEAVAMMKHKKTWCIFQPHTYTRTKFLLQEFATSFASVDEVILTDIFAAREVDDGSISSEMLAEKITEAGSVVHHISKFSDIVSFLEKNCSAGDLVLTLGAGDVYLIGEQFLGK
ncbi:MAG: UDP-N-acetylmuramate--L-alanine ligase [Bacillota bacterium]